MSDTISNKSRIPMWFIPTIFWCYSNFYFNLFAMETKDNSTDKHHENARFEFLKTVLTRFRGCRDVSTGKELPKWTYYLNGLSSSSLFS
jgi:hypothetical protein